MHTTSILFATLSLCACSATRAHPPRVPPSQSSPSQSSVEGQPASRAAASVRTSDELPLLATPTRGISIARSGAEEITIARLLEELERVTGQSVLATTEMRQILRASSVGATGDIELSPRAVYPFVETVLDQHDLVLVRANRDEPRLLSVHPAFGHNRRLLLGDAVHVPEDAMEECERHPALLVHTVVDVTPLRAGDMSLALKGRVDDGRLQEVQPLGDGHHVLLTGRGREVAQWVSILKRQTGAVRTTDDREVRGAPPTSASDATASSDGVRVAQEDASSRTSN